MTRLRIAAGSLAVLGAVGAAVLAWPRADSPAPADRARRADAARRAAIPVSAAQADVGARLADAAAVPLGPQLPAGLRAAESDAATARQAEALAALYREWDAELFASLMQEGSDPVTLEETLDWFHERLGECAPPEVLAVADSGSIRWVYPCAGGELETEFVMDDDGRVRRLMMGAHRIDPPPEVRAAADAIFGLQRAWNDDVFAAAFSEAFDRDDTRAVIEAFTAEWGVCAFAGVDLGGARGGLLEVDCDRGPRLLKVQLDDDDRIAETWFGDPRGF